MNAAPFLCIGGIELANDIRTQQYIRQGLLNDPRVTVALRKDVTSGAGYVDVYDDSYIEDPYWSQALKCYCGDYDEGPYVSPATDPAPWYEPARAESEDFIGLILEQVDVGSVLSRSLTPNSNGGGTLGRMIPRPRVIACSGIMFAASRAAMNYGARWLTDVLQGTYCTDGCASDEAIILPACSVDAEELTPPLVTGTDTQFRTLFDVGIADGPVFERVTEMSPECLVQRVSFQLVAAQPYLFAPETVCVEDELLFSGDDVCCEVNTEEWVGDTTMRIELSSPDTHLSGSVTVTAKVLISGACADIDPNLQPCWSYTVPEFEKGGRLVIDGPRRQVVYHNPTTKLPEGGHGKLTLNGPFVWPDIPPCTNVCVCVEHTGLSGRTSVTIESFPREI